MKGNGFFSQNENEMKRREWMDEYGVIWQISEHLYSNDQSTFISGNWESVQYERIIPGISLADPGGEFLHDPLPPLTAM